MTTAAELIALAEHTEALTGPCRETDAIIQAALNLPGTYLADHKGWDDMGHAIFAPGPVAFTASLDAAMTLVPEGHWWNIGHNAGPNPDTRDLYRGYCYPTGTHGPPPYIIAATPALALTAAALRARAAQVTP